MWQSMGKEIQTISQVTIQLFGLVGGSATKTRLSQPCEPDTTVQDIWQRLQREAHPEDRIATVDPAVLLVLVNGHPIDYLDGWETHVVESDVVTYMIKAAGG
jgi:hypothetical protein